MYSFYYLYGYSMTAIKLENTADFAEMIKDGVVLVDFFADWCGPCQVLLPVMDELATKYEGKAKIVKINVDQHSPIAQQFRVMSIPTVILFKDGEMVGSPVMGAYPEDHYVEMIDSALSA